MADEEPAKETGRQQPIAVNTVAPPVLANRHYCLAIGLASNRQRRPCEPANLVTIERLNAAACKPTSEQQSLVLERIHDGGISSAIHQE